MTKQELRALPAYGEGLDSFSVAASDYGIAHNICPYPQNTDEAFAWELGWNEEASYQARNEYTDEWEH